MAKVEITINGKKESREVEDRTLLANFIRDSVGLTGTHIGCDTTQCGCCTIHMNGRAVKSCTVLAVQANGADLLAIRSRPVKIGRRIKFASGFRARRLERGR